jgi:diaminopimelate decarboxylase
LTPFHYLNNQLYCEDVPLATLAQTYGTPLYVYSANRLRENYQRIAAAFAPLKPVVCYAVKANSNLALMKLLMAEGAGFDIVSGGELYRALKIGADPAHIVFAGVGKTESEIEQALLAKVGWINLESEGELRRVGDVAGRLGITARVAIRLRPDVEADTHHHISTGSAASKFGVPVAQALEMVQAQVPNVEIKGAHIHIGSQLGSPQATLQALEAMLGFVEAANALGTDITTLDLGGGFPVAYRDDENLPSVESFAALIVARLKGWWGDVHLEPGRSIVADAAALVTTVQYEKVDPQGRRIIIADAGMQTLIRPALYEAHHRTWPVTQKVDTPLSRADVAGPICESADFLARNRQLPNFQSGELLALLDAGAYGFSMASNYNSHPLPAEVLVEGESHRLIRKRQTYDDLLANEIG